MNSVSSDTHYKVLHNTDDTVKIQFGNGTYGKIPGNFDVKVKYGVGGGLKSNISATNKVTIYAGSHADIDATTNVEPNSGGADEESLSNAKIVAPMLLKSTNRFVKSSDAEALVLNAGGVEQLKVIPNYKNVLSVGIVVIPDGGGVPSPTLKQSIQDLLKDKSILESVTVYVLDPQYVVIDVASELRILQGYQYSEVLKFYELAWKLILYEGGIAIKNEYDANGIEAATTKINSVFSTQFTSNDYTQISKLLDVLVPAQFGVDLQDTNVKGYIDNYVDGVDFFNVILPIFPVQIADDEITSIGTITTTQI